MEKRKFRRALVLGVARKAFLGEKPGANDFTRKEIERINLRELPMCRMHDPDNSPGVWDECIAVNDRAYVMGHIDEVDPASSMVIKELKSGYLKDLSLNHYVWGIKGERDNNEMSLLKLPMEISLVDQGLQEGCHILGVFYEDELPTMDQNKSQQTAPTQAPLTQVPSPAPTPQANAVQTPIVPPQPLPQEMQADLDQVDEKSLAATPHDQLVKLTMVSLQKMKQMNNDAIDMRKYKEYVDQKAAQEVEDVKKMMYESLQEHGGKENADKFTPAMNNLFANQSFSELEEKGRLMRAVMANGAALKQKIAEQEKELENFRKGKAVAQEDYATALMRQVSSIGPQRTTGASQAKRFDPYDIRQAERTPEPQKTAPSIPPAINPESQKASAAPGGFNYPLPPQGTLLHEQVMRNPQAYHNLQTKTGGTVDPALIERIATSLLSPGATRMPK